MRPSGIHRIFLYDQHIDMRKGFEGLNHLVEASYPPVHQHIGTFFHAFLSALVGIGALIEVYNNVRLHSTIGYVVPADKLAGRDEDIFKERFEQARERRRK